MKIPKSKRIKTALFVCGLFFFYTNQNTAEASISQGDGTKENPYLITNRADWNDAYNRDFVHTSGSFHFKLANNLHLSDTDGAVLPLFRNYGEAVSFDGNDKVISVNNTKTEFEGLFSGYGNVQEIKNVKIGESTVVVGSEGGLLGINNRNSTIYNITSVENEFIHMTNSAASKAKPDGSAMIGGLFAYNYADLSKVMVNVDIDIKLDFEGYSRVGGISGFSNTKSVSASANGTVKGPSYTGGIFGESQDVMDNLSFKGEVSGKTNVGGAIALSTATDIKANVSGIIRGGANVGGIIANNAATHVEATFHGDVIGTNNVGGVSGYATSHYVSADVEGNISGNDSVGGIIGNSGVKTVDGDFTGEVHGQDSVGGVSGFAIAEKSDVRVKGIITGRNYVGGVIGNGSIKNLNANFEGDVTGEVRVGGIAGYSHADYAKVNSKANVIGTEFVGGVVGLSEDVRLEGVVRANVSGTKDVGGVAGFATSALDSATNQHTTGLFYVTYDTNVIGVENVGGAFGSFAGYLNTGYSNNYKLNSSVVEGDINVGGVVGILSGTVENSGVESKVISDKSFKTKTLVGLLVI